MGLLVDGSTLLRQLRQRSSATATARAPRVLGIDDWAWRKGHRYGTILCDLESRRVVDLLPDRESETVATWCQRYLKIPRIHRLKNPQLRPKPSILTRGGSDAATGGFYGDTAAAS
jgi:hypothetical protein